MNKDAINSVVEGLPDLPLSNSDLREYYQTAINATKDLTESKDTSCALKCSFCCYIHVDVTLVEASVLAKKVLPKHVETLKEQATKTVDTWKELPFQKRKCVFLSRGSCTVYNQRPLACRKYFVVSPKENCDTKKETKKVLTMVSYKAEFLSMALFAKYGSYSLPKALLWVLKK